MKKTKQNLVGAHLSIAGGFHQALLEARLIGATACQIFVKNGRSWKAKPLTEDRVKRYHEVMDEDESIAMVAHASYLINIASPNDLTHSNSTQALIDELTRCDQLKIPYLVLHPGSHVGSGVEAGCLKIAQTIDAIYKEHRFKTKLLLETAAGQGTNLASTFKELQLILSQIQHRSHVGVCFDTCHVHAAGYSLYPHEDYLATMKQFDAIVGLEQIKVIHLNNSKTERGSKKDRHEKLIKGVMPESVFIDIMHDKRFEDVLKILETPIEKDYLDEYRQELEWLSSL